MIANAKIVVSVSFSGNREYPDYREYQVFLSEFMTTNSIKPRTFSTDEQSFRDLRHLEYINFLNLQFLSFACCYDVFCCCLGEKSKPS